MWKVEGDSHLVYRPGGNVGGLSASRLCGMAGSLQDTMMDEEKKLPGGVLLRHMAVLVASAVLVV